MIQEIINVAMAHKAAISVAAAWALREAHNIWPFVRPSVSLPFLRMNGGLKGITKTILSGWTPGKDDSTAKPENSK